MEVELYIRQYRNKNNVDRKPQIKMAMVPKALFKMAQTYLFTEIGAYNVYQSGKLQYNYFEVKSPRLQSAVRELEEKFKEQGYDIHFIDVKERE